MTPTAQQWIDESSTFSTADGNRISFRRNGSGPTILLLHGFPTWSYDYAEVATELASDHDVITFDFLGYGASDKPRNHEYTVGAAADVVQDLLAHLKVDHVSLVLHDFGGIVGQELLDRSLPFTIDAVYMLNSGIVYSEYRPTIVQKLLATPVVWSRS